MAPDGPHVGPTNLAIRGTSLACARDEPAACREYHGSDNPYDIMNIMEHITIYRAAYLEKKDWNTAKVACRNIKYVKYVNWKAL